MQRQEIDHIKSDYQRIFFVELTGHESRPGMKGTRGLGPTMAMTEVVGLGHMGGNNYLLSLLAGHGEYAALGRFARLRGWPTSQAGVGSLLDPPISIHRINGKTLQFLVRRVGPATTALTSLSIGASVRLIGPLGRGLDELDPGFREKKWYLVAGGIGLGPMPSLLE
ncbi:MAG: hypothetical protein LBU69_05870, partial [Deltaproteobacteria bacterium]|nr:hypothetical protein [Deltaproteobacteria bacterium]